MALARCWTLAWLLLASLATSSAEEAPSRRLACAQIDKVSLQLKWFVQAQFMGYLAARDIGGPFGNLFKTEECLLTQIRAGDPTLDPVQEVIDGFSDVGIVTAASFIQAVQAGHNLTAVAAFAQKNGMMLAARKDFCGRSEPPCSLQDFEGQTLGLSRDGFVPVRQLLQQEGVTASDVFKGFGAQQMLDMEGYVGAALMIFNEWGVAQETLNPATGYLWQPEEFLVWDNLAPKVDEVLVVRDSTLRDRPDVLRRFLRGVVKGWVLCREDEDRCINVLPNSDKDHQRFMLREMNRLTFPSPNGLGTYAPDDYWSAAQLLVDFGQMAGLPASLKVDNSLIQQAVAEVIAEGNPKYPDVNGLLFAKASLQMCAQKGTSNYHVCQGLENTLCGPGQHPIDHGVCGPCSPGQFVPEEDRGSSCQLCPAGFFASEPGSSQCTQCPLGRFANETGSTSCTECPAGSFGEIGVRVKCNLCPSGTYREMPGGELATNCLKCEAGTVGAEPGRTACANCTAGFYAAELGKTECLACPLGEYTDAAGRSGCLRCPLGHYADQRNSTVCSACLVAGSGTRTPGARSSEECVCDQGSYLASGGSCRPCPDKMLCPQGSSEASLLSVAGGGGPLHDSEGEQVPYPLVLEGFWTSSEQPLSVFRCADTLRCPGGPPAACAASLEHQACAQCVAGHQWNGQECSRCSAPEKSQALFPVLPLFLVLVIVAVLYALFRDEYEGWSSWQNACMSIGFLVLNHFQVITLVGQANLDIPSTSGRFFELWTWTQDLLAIFKVECAGFGSFTDMVMWKALAPLLVLAATVVLFVGSQLIARATQAAACVAMERSRTWNVYFSLVFTFFNGIAAMSLSLFKCSQSPNGKLTLTQDPSINCYEDTWSSVAAIGVLAFLLYCVGCSLLFAWAIRSATRNARFAKRDFQMMWKFLFIKFRPDVHWWALVLLARGVFFNLAFVVLVNGFQQLLCIMVLETLYLLLSAYYLPWRFRVTNAVSILTSLSIIYACALNGAYTERDAELESWLPIVSIVFHMLPPLFCVGAVAVTAARGMSAKKWGPESTLRPEETEKLLGACTALLRLRKEDFKEMYLSLGDWDRWFCRKFSEVVASECVGIQSKWRATNRSNSAEETPKSLSGLELPKPVDRMVIV